MIQSNDLKLEAFFSAVKKISNISTHQNLIKIKEGEFSQNYFLRSKKNKCLCPQENLKSNYPKFIFPITYFYKTEKNEAHFESYPFFYVISCQLLKSFKIIDIVEIPVINSDFYFKNKQNLEEIQNKVPTESMLISFPNLKSNFKINEIEINKVRMSVFREVKNKFLQNVLIYFSCFCEKISIPWNQSLNDYIQEIENAQSNHLGLKHSTRYLPIKIYSELKFLRLECFFVE